MNEMKEMRYVNGLRFFFFLVWLFFLKSSQGSEMSRVLGAGFGDHMRKDRIRVVEQVARGIVLSDLSLAHDQDTIVINDGVDTMGDRHHGRVSEIDSDRLLDQCIRGHVDTGRGYDTHTKENKGSVSSKCAQERIMTA